MDSDLLYDLEIALERLCSAVDAEISTAQSAPAGPGTATARMDAHAFMIQGLAEIIANILVDLACVGRRTCRRGSRIYRGPLRTSTTSKNSRMADWRRPGSRTRGFPGGTVTGA